MAQLQAIPSSISIDQTLKVGDNPSNVVYNLQNNNFIHLLNKVHNSQTQSSQSQNSSSQENLIIKDNQDLNLMIPYNKQFRRVNSDQRALRFSQLENVNFGMILQSQSSKSDDQQSITDDEKIQQRFVSNNSSCQNISHMKLKNKEEYLSKNNCTLFTKEKPSLNSKNVNNINLLKYQQFHNNSKITLTAPTQSSKLCKKSLKERIIHNKKDIDKDQNNIKLLLMKQIHKNKQLQNQLEHTQKQNSYLRQIIIQLNRKTKQQNYSYNNQNIEYLNPSIRNKSSLTKSKVKKSSNENKNKQQKQNKNKAKEMIQMKKQIVKLQQILNKLNKNINGIQLKQRKIKVTSAVQKSKQRFQTEAKQKTSTY